MHDIDRTQQFIEAAPNDEVWGGGGEFDQESESEFDFDSESAQGGYGGQGQSTQWEDEAAIDLLSVSNDQELDQFVGRLLSKAAKGVRGFARSSLGRQLGGLVKDAATKAVPIIGAAAGDRMRQAGGAYGHAADILGLEVEGLSPEDQEFQLAKRVVRLATDAARQASRQASSGPAGKVARQAITSAARRHAPGLLRAMNMEWETSPGGGSASGRWVRQGKNIIIYGA